MNLSYKDEHANQTLLDNSTTYGEIRALYSTDITNAKPMEKKLKKKNRKKETSYGSTHHTQEAYQLT